MVELGFPVSKTLTEDRTIIGVGLNFLPRDIGDRIGISTVLGRTNNPDRKTDYPTTIPVRYLITYLAPST